MYSFKAQHKIVWMLIFLIFFIGAYYMVLQLPTSLGSIGAFLKFLMIILPIFAVYACSIGILYYPTSAVELRPYEVMVKKGQREIIVPVADIRSVSCVTARLFGKGKHMSAFVYYRIVIQESHSKIKKIYFRDFLVNLPPLSLGGWKEQVDRSEEFMIYIKTGKSLSII